MEAQKSSCACGAEGKNRIIYSCSGIGSNVGQLANAAACRLASEGYGGGSCLAGVGGGIEKLVGMGKGADERIVIDGCPVACAKKIMDDRNFYDRPLCPDHGSRYYEDTGSRIQRERCADRCRCSQDRIARILCAVPVTARYADMKPSYQSIAIVRQNPCHGTRTRSSPASFSGTLSPAAIPEDV